MRFQCETDQTTGYLSIVFRLNSKKIEIFWPVRELPVGARETRLPVGNQISRPVTKTMTVTFWEVSFWRTLFAG